MAAIANSTKRTFPDQQEIVNFYQNHETKKAESFSANVFKYIPDGIEKISEFFAGNTISRNEIESKVHTVLTGNISDKDSNKVAFRWCVDLHTKVILDLFDKVAFIPPESGETFETKQVEDLTKKKT
jgi:hypothetical protein